MQYPPTYIQVVNFFGQPTYPNLILSNFSSCAYFMMSNLDLAKINSI